MPTEFNVSDFRRRRTAGEGIPAQPGPPPMHQAHPHDHAVASEPAAIPVPMPSSPQFPAQSVPATAPDVMANPYAAALQSQAATPVSQVMAPLPAHQPHQTPSIRSTIPAPQHGSSPVQTREASEKPANLFAGLAKKLKPSGKKKPTKPVPDNASADLSGPVPFNPRHESPVGAPIPEPVMAPVMNEFENPLQTFTASEPEDQSVKVKPSLPVWAAFALGVMAGIILTFGALVFFGNSAPTNTLEARFGQGQQTAQAEPSAIESAAVDEDTAGDAAVIPAGR